MIRETILLTCLLFIAAFVSAQQTSLGLRAGYTLSDVLINEPDGLVADGNPDLQLDAYYQSYSSFHFGADALLPLGERVSILSSLLYARKGFVGKTTNETWQLNYLNLPVVADVRLWKGLSVQAGVEAGWLLDTRVKSSGQWYSPDNSFVGMNDFDFGLVAGLEYRFEKGFFIGARHIFGVAPLQKLEITNANGEEYSDVTTRNSATQISAGYRYTFGE